MINRRAMLKSVGTAAFGIIAGSASRTVAASADIMNLPFANGARPLVKYPGKRPLIGLTSRPPQLETPFSVFNEGLITPNDAFYVRYHLSDIPLQIDPVKFRLEIKGLVNAPLSISLDELKTAYEPLEYIAVHQCSGNSRGFFEPRVGGGQLGNGAMGNARWKGVPLKSILAKAGVKQGAVEVSFGGLDGPVVAETPDFVKALGLDHALDGEVMLAYEMNGEELPWLNGFPLRLVVPGWYGTYWVKHLNEINVLDAPFDGFWMKTAYRIPDNDCACTEPGKDAEKTIPINRFNVRSFITSVADGAKVTANASTTLRGIAFNGGAGIEDVSISIDSGATWQLATLGKDLGKYSFREWTFPTNFSKGDYTLMVRAIGQDGETQPSKAQWNPTGYMRNVIETTKITAT